MGRVSGGTVGTSAPSPQTVAGGGRFEFAAVRLYSPTGVACVTPCFARWAQSHYAPRFGQKGSGVSATVAGTYAREANAGSCSTTVTGAADNQSRVRSNFPPEGLVWPLICL